MVERQLEFSLKVGDIVNFKNPNIKHQLAKKTCLVMEVKGEEIKLIEKGSPLNQPQYWVSAKVSDVELLTKSEDLESQKDSLKDKVIEDIGNNTKTSELSSATKKPKPESQITEPTKEEEIINNNSDLSEQNQPTSSFSNQEKSLGKKQVQSSLSTDKVTDQNHDNSVHKNSSSATKSESKLDDHQQKIDINCLNNNPDNQEQTSLEISQNNLENSSQQKPEQKPVIKSLKLEQITVNEQTQSRCKLDQETIVDYAESIKNGAKFPPITIFCDGKKYYLADGYHRLEAHKIAGIGEIQTEIKQGSLDDAILYSVGANETHGLRRTNADKKKAVKTVLQNSQWKEWSDNYIASICAVSHPFVGKIRKELYPDEEKQERTYTNKHGSVTTMKTKKIGKKKSKNKDNSTQSSLVNNKSFDNSTKPETTKDREIEVSTNSTHIEITSDGENEVNIDSATPETTGDDKTDVNSHPTTPETTGDSKTDVDSHSINPETTGDSKTDVDSHSANLETTSSVNDSEKQSVDLQQLRDSIAVIQKQIFQIVTDTYKEQVTNVFNLLNEILANY